MTDDRNQENLDDLPDIIDCVQAMSVASSVPPLPRHLAGLADRARDYVEAASSANTVAPTLPTGGSTRGIVKLSTNGRRGRP